MNKSAILLLLALFTASPALASDKTDAMIPVHQFLDGFNKGDFKFAAAACASPAFILDEFPPHGWQGANACNDWKNDFDTFAKANAITNPVVRIKKIVSVDVNGDRAYVVTNTSYDWIENGKPMKEKASIWTFALQKLGQNWRIVGWAWSKH